MHLVGVELGVLADGDGGGSGTGNGTVNYSVAANTASAARSATLSIGSATFTVTQNGSCVYTVTPTSQGFNPASRPAASP